MCARVFIVTILFTGAMKLPLTFCPFVLKIFFSQSLKRSDVAISVTLPRIFNARCRRTVHNLCRCFARSFARSWSLTQSVRLQQSQPTINFQKHTVALIHFLDLHFIAMLFFFMSYLYYVSVFVCTECVWLMCFSHFGLMSVLVIIDLEDRRWTCNFAL